MKRKEPESIDEFLMNELIDEDEVDTLVSESYNDISIDCLLEIQDQVLF